ncbi:glycoside hydrolase superfamily [Cercophora scortea]|uniref:Glycoside hydrolase superfamily n=1 Tax=Cercophora scortea TaxID=314031 RepID=A0AAE0I738_9PEZI|nr:glycoside hydrolase superfamily [Cercophora scortea]
MKTHALALLFLGIAAAQPSLLGKGHGHLHRLGYGDGRAVSVVDSSADSERDIPEVVVFVDEQGNPLETTSQVLRIVPGPGDGGQSGGLGGHHGSGHGHGHGHGQGQGQQEQQHPAIAPPHREPQPQPEQEEGGRIDPPSNPITDNNNNPPRPVLPAPGTPLPLVLPQSTNSSLPGVTYSPYNADGTCRAAADIYSDFQSLSSLYSLVRIYGVDCNQVASILPAAASISARVFLGIFNLDDLDSQIATLVSAVTTYGSWSQIDTISVGNELVNNGQATADQVISAVSAARTSLRSAGYTGPVVTVDTFTAVIANPLLCDASDYCAMNIHAFFDPNTPAPQAGNFVLRQVANVREVLADPAQRIVVTESGWPWQGNANGLAVPGRENQLVAVQAIVDAYAEGGIMGIWCFLRRLMIIGNGRRRIRFMRSSFGGCISVAWDELR